MQLYQGDCLEVMKMIPDNSIDLVLCDPPYGTTHCEWDKALDLDALWKEYRRICKEHCAILLFSAQPFTSELIMSNRKDFRYEIIWEKTQPSGFLNAKRMPLRNHENIVVFYQKLPTYNPIKHKAKNPKTIGRKKVNGTQAKQYNSYITGRYEWTETGERMPTDVIQFSNWNGARFGDTSKAVKHSTTKPVPLLEYLIKTYSNEGDMVLDNTMGSGSTGVACVNTNRDFIGIELTEHFFGIAYERINEATGQGVQKPQSEQMTIFDL